MEKEIIDCLNNISLALWSIFTALCIWLPAIVFHRKKEGFKRW